MKSQKLNILAHCTRAVHLMILSVAEVRPHELSSWHGVSALVRYAREYDEGDSISPHSHFRQNHVYSFKT